MIKIPSEIMTVINKLNENGFDAYVVGGCVRDSVMGRCPNDWDVTTNALPHEMQEMFSSFKTINTGLKHGTLMIMSDGVPVEATTFRLDGEYSDNRHPDSVEFTDDITKDLSRRDFTVNAMAYSPDKGIIDPFCGISDIEKKVIRCVGDAEKRFNEDALRILRAIRFSSVLDFKIDESTSDAIFNCKNLLSNISVERIAVELMKLLSGKNVFEVLMEYKDILGVFIPELKDEFGFSQYGKKHAYDVWEHTAHTVENIENEPILRLTMLLHDVGKPSTHKLNDKGDSTFKNHAKEGGIIAEQILKRLKFSKAMTEKVTLLVTIHDKEVPETRAEVKQYLREYGCENFLLLMKIRKADKSGLSEGFRDISDKLSFAYGQYDSIIENNEPYKLSQLAVNGRNIKKCGVCDEKIGEVLEKLLDIVIENPEKNTKELLLSYIPAMC